MARKTKAKAAAEITIPPELVGPGTQPLVGLTYEEVIDTLVGNIERVFVDNDCTLQDAKVAVDMFKDQLLAMTNAAEGPRAAQELAFKFVQGCMPYIFNDQLDDDPRASFKSILENVRNAIAKE